MAAKLYKDLTPAEQKARDAELKDFVRGAKFSPMDLLGAPVDLTTMAMRGVGIPVPEKPFLGSEYLIDKYADLGEALDINYDRPTGSGMETFGRVVAGTAGLGGEAAVALAPGIGKLFAKATKTRGSGIEVKGSGNIEMGASSTPGKYDEFFENMGEEGAGMEFPAVGQAVDNYVTEFDPKESFDLLDGALKSDDYPGYATALRANLDRQFPGDKISVSRIENYSDPQAGIEGRRSKSFFEVDKDDVLFAGSDSERELIIRGPKGTYNEGGPMSVRIEEAPPSDLGPTPSDGTTFFREESLAKNINEAKRPNSRETITYMSPDEFLTLAEKGESPKKLAGVRELVDNDTKFSSLPFLRFSHDGKGMAKVESHEGRHRMMVLKDAGVERVPVLFESSEMGKGRAIRWGSQDPDSFDFVPPQERPTRITSQDGDAVLPMFDSDIYPVLNEAPTTVAPKKEVLEGEVVGTKSKKYMKLEKEMGEARTPELRAARELNMETQGVEDAFDLNAASNIDKNFEFASGGDDVRATSDDFIGGVIDEYQGARDQGFNRGDALVDAVRVKVNDYNEIYPDALDLNSVLDDLSRNVNDDFGFDQALGRFREGQSNRKALEAELQTAKFKNMREAQEAATRVREEQLGIAGLSDAEKAAFYRNMGEQEQRGIVGAGIPDPDPPKPNLRLVKKAKGGPVDMRSGIGDLFKVYS
tara:strand:+ start:1201 stop:3303 length:2103 start_codon:yes stop_codon:yes gene_type:complete